MVGRDAAHVVVAGRQDGDRLTRVTSTPAKMRAVSAMPGRRSWITFGSRCSTCSSMWSLFGRAAASRISMVIERLTTSRDARSLADGA